MTNIIDIGEIYDTDNLEIKPNVLINILEVIKIKFSQNLAFLLGKMLHFNESERYSSS